MNRFVLAKEWIYFEVDVLVWCFLMTSEGVIENDILFIFNFI